MSTPAATPPIPLVELGSDHIRAIIEGATLASAKPTDPTNPMRPWTVRVDLGHASYTFDVANIGGARCVVNALAQAYIAGHEAGQAR
ncbi:hypothetical protein [Mycobacteroides abscessus]|uniref:hypothetical protein n=1 Tax=Mycobacteroides abscessus TaxID=36809 RepID=UPI0005E13B05|nr:hypothetical protein [Mycobacteroides abscessus]CPW40566.1 Uncharacterised protein [Mycobacteroides abscessus]SKF60046.1 Uncharacterised protein [Mycobacteroides abscessus subsp. bolletii]SKH51911.1 Uncharacterised protein [Mycobacteroides abscessus subsp. bolletii]